jgi:predicted nuclease of predicted toxin-antitoxin system
MLLFDENISHRIILELKNTFFNCKHITDFSKSGIDDDEVWQIAKTNNLSIVTFDADYEDILSLKGFPPKVIWLRFGNSSTKKIQKTLLHYSETIVAFLKNESLGILEITEAYS